MLIRNVKQTNLVAKHTQVLHGAEVSGHFLLEVIRGVGPGERIPFARQAMQ
jgi:hypothetical protein